MIRAAAASLPVAVVVAVDRLGGIRSVRCGGWSWAFGSAWVAEADIAGVTRVQTAGNTVVVAVNLVVPADAVAQQVVLVGTPNG